MDGYIVIPTTKEVFAVLHASHDLKVFSSYSEPHGSYRGQYNLCGMFTEYGVDGCDFPILRAETTWDKPEEGSYVRANETHRYWLCIADAKQVMGDSDE